LFVLWAVIFCFAVTDDKGIRIQFILQFLRKKTFPVVPHKFTFDDIALDDIFILVPQVPFARMS
jgi:hypothetical protein